MGRFPFCYWEAPRLPDVLLEAHRAWREADLHPCLSAATEHCVSVPGRITHALGSRVLVHQFRLEEGGILRVLQLWGKLKLHLAG